MLTLTSKSTILPMELDVFKRHCRISTSSTKEDALIETYAWAAVAVGEHHTGREWTTSARVLILDEFPGDDEAIEIPCPPLTTVDSTLGVKVDYTNSTGGSTSLATTVYTVDSEREPGRLYLQYEQVWPDTRSQRKAVRVTFQCGYSTATIPANAKNWLLLRVAAAYENREAIVFDENRVAMLPRSFLDGLLDSLIVPSV